MFLFEFADADDEARNAITVIDREHLVGKLGRAVDIAVRKLGKKRAAQKIGVVRIELEHVEVVGGGGALVALG